MKYEHVPLKMKEMMSLYKLESKNFDFYSALRLKIQKLIGYRTISNTRNTDSGNTVNSLVLGTNVGLAVDMSIHFSMRRYKQ